MPSKPQEKKHNAKQPHLLVVGDWVVDEYWHLVRHHSEISSHVGFTHFRTSPRRGEAAAARDEEVFMDLCGAGHVTRILRRLDHEHRWRIWGVGSWQKSDQKFIDVLVRGDGHCNVRRAFLFPEGGNPSDENVILVNLEPEEGRTTRVVRLYHNTGSGIEQVSRIDWELPTDERREPRLGGPFEQLPASVDAIVVHDLRKGVVTPELIEALKIKYPEADWYVRRKGLDTPWLSTIGKRLRLLLIGPEILNMRNPWRRWQTRKRLTHLAFELLQEIRQSRLPKLQDAPDTGTPHDAPHLSIVLLSDFRETIALTEENARCLTTVGVEVVDPLGQVGWSSAFFGAMVYKLRSMQRGPTASCVTKDVIESAVKAANRHRYPLRNIHSPQDSPAFPINEIDWIAERQAWEDAQRRLGIIDDPDDDADVDSASPRLEVWRGCMALPGYVACIPEKSQIINNIGRHLRHFNRNAATSRSVSILLQADPGTGKTFLAKLLADIFDFKLVKWDITQMVARSDLLDLFDSVATEQANQRKPVLVFVDEVNALLAGSHVYGAFLAPLEEGSYVRHGKAFNLQPCVWLFAGTGFDSGHQPKAEKVEDFKARMTFIAEFDFATLKARSAEDAQLILDARREQVYLGAFLIRQLYPDVTHVSRDVLKRFYDLNPAQAPARIIRNLIMKLRNVQYGMITGKNCESWGPPIPDNEPLVQLVFP